MNEQTGTMTEAIKELVAIGASVGAHCQPCLEYHIQAAVEIGVSEADIRAAVAVGQTVEKGAMAAMKKFSAEAVEEILSATRQTKNQADETAIEKETTKMVVKIYDPAMCCSSGVCGPSVDLYRSTVFWTRFVVNHAASVMASFWMARTAAGVL